jgi:hypothetical protein
LSSQVPPRMERGLVSLPRIVNKLIPDTENTAWDDLGQRVVRGFVLHRMERSLEQTDRDQRAVGNAYSLLIETGVAGGELFDFGQDAQGDTVFQWNDPTGAPGPGIAPNRAGWASGPFSANGDAYGDGLAFVGKYGIAAVNRDQVSWAISGTYEDPWTEAAMNVAAQVCAHYAHDYGIPHDRFPIAPQDGVSFIRWHQELCGPAEQACPGEVVISQTDIFIKKVAAILRTAQLSLDY